MMILKTLMSYFPSPLPVGMTEFDKWAQSIRDISGPGLENVPQDQFRWVLSSAIQHLKHTESNVPKRYFVHVIRKGAASQVAGQVFMEVKLAQEKAAQEAEALKKQQDAEMQKLQQSAQPAEATADTVGSDGQPEEKN